MDTYEQRLAAWETELRDKYSDADRKDMAGKEAMGDGSYPIKDAADLENAIRAVGRGNADHDAIRKHIMTRAAALDLSNEIPDNWNTDGSLKQSNGRRQRGPRRRAVPLTPEVRFFAPTGLEVRSATDNDDEIVITGAPIVYGAAYRVADMFGEFEERIHAGSVSDLLARGVDCRFLLNHEGMAMARTTSGTLRLIDGASQLGFEARLDARQQLANDFAIAVERGDMTQMSIGMIVGNDAWGQDGQTETRDIYGLSDLLDISGVTYPCSPTTHMAVAKRMAMAMPMESRARLRQMEVELRAGKALSSSSQAKLVTALAALHDLASAGGIDPATLGPAENNEGDPPTEADGSDGGLTADADAGIVYPDGSGQRAADQDDTETREIVDEPPVATPDTHKASLLRLRVEASRLNRPKVTQAL